MPPHQRPVNLMFQSYALFPHMSVEKNVAYGLEREGCARAEMRRRVGEVLETVGLTRLAGRRPAAAVRRPAAAGRARPRHREAPAAAAARRAALGAGQARSAREMQLELKRLQHEVGITFVVVTHDQEEAMSMADRIAVFDERHVEQVDAPEELYERPRTPFVAGFVGANNLFAGRACSAAWRVERRGRRAARRAAAEPARAGAPGAAGRAAGGASSWRRGRDRARCAAPSSTSASTAASPRLGPVAGPVPRQPVLVAAPGATSVRAGAPVAVRLGGRGTAVIPRRADQ